MLVLGIDPGTAKTGYGLVQESREGLLMVAYGAIETEPELPPERRLLLIHQKLNEIILLHKPVSAAVEKLFFQRNVTTAMNVSQARGVILLAMAQNGIKVSEYTPLQVKQAVAGYGGAGKSQVQQMVKALLGLEQLPHPDDAADALAVAICHLSIARFNEMAEANYE
jgi:crossover junction endodeoxyribonuclease RuvC